MNPSSHHGFTLFELLATVAILGILTAFTWNPLQDYVAQTRASLFSRSLMHHLQWGRNQAILQNRPVTICPSSDGTTCSKSRKWRDTLLVFVDANNNGKHEKPERVLKTVELQLLQGELTWRSFGNRNYLLWLPTGGTYYQNGNFTWCPDNRQLRHARKIIINNAGRAYVGHDTNNDGIQEGTDGKNLTCHPA